MGRIIPPVIAVTWVGTQLAMVAVAGGRRRYPGQALVAGVLGAGSLALGGLALGRFGSAGTTPDPLHPDEASTLVTEGVYGYTRNPMYLSILVGLLAVTAGTGRFRTLLALPGMIASLQPQLEAEESALTELFGDEYAAYCARVRRWL